MKSSTHLLSLLFVVACSAPPAAAPVADPEPVAPEPTAKQAASYELPPCEICDALQTSNDGKYFCGVSQPALDEATARNDAMANARKQVVTYLGTYIATQSSTTSSLVKGTIDDGRVVTEVSAGLASQVKDVRWCAPAIRKTPNGRTITERVLAFYPNDARVDGAKSAAEAIIAVRKAQNAINPDEERSLRSAVGSGK